MNLDVVINLMNESRNINDFCSCLFFVIYQIMPGDIYSIAQQANTLEGMEGVCIVNYIHKIYLCAKKTVVILLFLGPPLMITGCQKSAHNAPAPTVSPLVSQSAPLPEPVMSEPQPTAKPESVAEGTASLCQKELIVLSKVNSNLYARKKAEFDRLLSSASVYTSVRDEISGETRDTMDSLYKYKTQRFCSEVEQSVRETLFKRGERL